MTLEQACAELEATVAVCLTDPYQEDPYDRIMEAVKNVALAVAQRLGPVNTNRVSFNEVVAELERLIGEVKHGK